MDSNHRFGMQEQEGSGAHDTVDDYGEVVKAIVPASRRQVVDCYGVTVDMNNVYNEVATDTADLETGEAA